MARETLAFSDAFHQAFILQKDTQRCLGQEIPWLMLTYSNILSDVITGNKYTKKKRLMVDITAVREAYKAGIISNIGFIRLEFNPADAMTKVGRNTALE